MIDIKKIDIEYKTAAVFGACSLFLSFTLGLIAGNPAGDIFLKSLISAVVFAGVGYAGIFIIKKYVPEVYEIFNSGAVSRFEETQYADADENASGEMPDGGTGLAGDAGIDEIEEPGLPAGKLKDDESVSELHDLADEEKKTSAGKEREKTFRYQPEIAAQAIRTMMKRDDK